ncbi:MAG: hypothetical protein A3E78_14595 [Alphaproteobacteria bacterium RIFCSPHIGHO2_12_FULL_63_12]|nr:MAG: hypothetical protein A3E78_14595 [Alphaproteobacteria bacterium RIFCSPHIGHO2_12_FULL_63_12]
MPRLTVIIVTYNAGDRLNRCLEHLSRQTFSDFETIVVDNGSADGSIAAARRHYPTAKFDDVGANLGFAAANNRAAKTAAGEWLVFLNPDAYADPDWLQELVAASGRYPWADAFGSTQIRANEPSLIDGAGDVFNVFGIPYRGHYGWPLESLPPEGECFSPCAAAAMYRKKAFDRLGGFDERFFCYGEDVDLGFRLRLSGGRAVQVKAARVLHEGSGITGRRSEFSVYHGHRNRIWIAAKNLPGVLYWGTAPLRLAADFALFAKHVSHGLGGAYWRAMDDGYRRAKEFRTDSHARRLRQYARIADVATMIDWSVLKLLKRQASIAPVGTLPEQEIVGVQ